MNRPNSPYENFIKEEARKRHRDYCYATTLEEHLVIFKTKSLLDLKNWRANCRKMLGDHIERGDHLLPEYGDKCANLEVRINYIDAEIDRREAVWTPRNPKATDSLWKSKLKVMDERAAKRQKIEEKTDLLPPRRSFQPLGYDSEKEKQKYEGLTVLEEKFSFNCTETLGEEEEEQD